MGMNQQFGCAAFAFVKLIESNLKKWNHSKWQMPLNRCSHSPAACCRKIPPPKKVRDTSAGREGLSKLSTIRNVRVITLL